MPKVLTRAQIDQFHEQGFVSPILVMSDAEALGYRSRLERFERGQADRSAATYGTRRISCSLS